MQELEIELARYQMEDLGAGTSGAAAGVDQVAGEGSDTASDLDPCGQGPSTCPSSRRKSKRSFLFVFGKIENVFCGFLF